MVKHILVVNPNVIEAEKIKSRMGSSTTEVVCAYTIQQAIRYFDEIEFCLVILDANNLKQKRVTKRLLSFVFLSFVWLAPARHHDCATCCAERRLLFCKTKSKLAVERSETVSHGSSPAGGAIFGGQFDNSSRKSLFYKDFFGFLGEILKKYFVTTPCEPSGLEPSTIF